MENQHRLTFAAQRPKRLLIELDDQVLLSISGAPKVEETITEDAMAGGTPALVISDFSQCVVEYLEYGSVRPHVRCFGHGTVTLVAPS